MKNLLKLLGSRLSPKTLLRIITVVSLVGVADTVYLAANHYSGVDVRCFLLEGCEMVLTSSYSTIIGIPLAILGVIFYSGIFILVNLIDLYGGKFLPKALVGVGIIGFVASLYFLYLQVFIIEALCIYCLISLTSLTVIFILAIMVYKHE